MTAGLALVMAGVCLTTALGQTLQQTSGPWVMERSGTTAGLRGIHAVGGGVAWASGTNGTVLRTEDGGYEWQSCAMPPGAEKLDFRGIWAWDANTAIVMSSGPGDQSRLYKTTDGCSSWKLLYTNPDQDGFWDAVVFADRRYGILIGDPTVATAGTKSEFEMTLLATFDGGGHWSRPDDYLQIRRNPIAVPRGTGAFAASNSSLFIDGRQAWFGVGGTGGARVFLGDYYGSTPGFACNCGPPPPPDQIWFTHLADVPVGRRTEASGVFSISGRRSDSSGQDLILVAVGGDYSKPNESAETAAWSVDGGKTWTAAVKSPHGYRSAVAWDADAKAWIAAGTNGSDISYDDGKTWEPLDNGNWNALSLPWVVGPNGRIAKLGKLPARK